MIFLQMDGVMPIVIMPLVIMMMEIVVIVFQLNHLILKVLSYDANLYFTNGLCNLKFVLLPQAAVRNMDCCI